MAELRAYKESGSIVSFLGFLIFLTASLVVLFFFVFGKVVPPNMIGIRRNYVSVPGVLSSGYNEVGLSPGLHWKAPFISNLVLIPRDFQFIQMGKETAGDLSIEKLKVPTTDGSFVDTDISLIVRFFDRPGTTVRTGTTDNQTEQHVGEDAVPVVKEVTRVHGGPKNLVNIYGSDYSKQLSTFTINAESNLKKYLSSLSTTGFFNPVLREKATLKATEEINKEVNDKGVELWATLILRYVYERQTIDDQIFAKNLQDASKKLNHALSNLAEAKASTEKVLAQWDSQKIHTLKVEGQTIVQVVEEEGKRYEEEKIAQGNRLVEVAQSEIEKSKNEILASQGGKVYTARKLVPFLTSLKGGIVSGVDPYNINSWIKKLANDVNQGDK